MRAIIKTCTYLIIDLICHASIVYFAGNIFGYKVSIEEAGIIGLIIEVIETIAYYIHEKIWEKIKL